MSNYFKNKIDAYLTKRIEEFTEKSINENARNPDGSINEPLAKNIRIEIKRCEAMGRELEIYEPLRWIFMQTGLAFVAGAIFKFFQKDKKISTPVLLALGVETAAINAIHLFRLFPRFNARLRGGVDAAMEVQKIRAEDEVAVIEKQSYENAPLTSAAPENNRPREKSPASDAWTQKISPGKDAPAERSMM